MFRLRELSAGIREVAGPTVTEVFAAITRLGDPLFLLVLLAVYYWLAERRDAPANLIAFTLLAVALTVSLKNGLAIPRPPADVQAVGEYSDSYGFPSGHAIGATVVYGGFVAVEQRLRRPVPAVAAASLVGLIGLSRVVIGVHYLGDVLAGFAVGGVVIALLRYGRPGRRPLVAAVAAVAAVPAVVVTAGGADSTLAFGSCLGAVAVFGTLDTDSLPTAETLGAGGVLVTGGLAVLGGAYAVAQAVGHPVAFAVAGVVMLGGSLVLPLTLSVEPVSRIVSE